MAFIFTSEQIAEITGGKWLNNNIPDETFNYVFTDSRNFYQKNGELFIAIVGERFDGHIFCEELANLGQRFFIVSRPINLSENCFQLIVEDTLDALQSLATAHRNKFTGKVIGITGSNGKTIVKEWLFELLSTKYQVYRSPKSFNSQIGVALSILKANTEFDYYIIEAGISKKGEMVKLAAMIKPDYGVLTHLGIAHNEGFDSMEDKFKEKCNLFASATKIFFQDKITMMRKFPFAGETISVGNDFSSDYLFAYYETNFTVKTMTKSWLFESLLNDEISKENMSLALTVALDIGIEADSIKKKINYLQTPSMRLELLEGQYNSTIVNDTWTNDPDALKAAIDFLMQQKKQKKTCLILSDYPENAREDVYKQTADLVKRKQFDAFVGIGKQWKKHQEIIHIPNKSFYFTAREFLNDLEPKKYENTAILIKGSRKFQLEIVATRLQQKNHETVLEINLDNLAFNYHLLKNKLQPSTKIMAMVKAFAYGSGNYEVARLLEHHRVDYFAVAYIDEGIELRNSGIKTPILVLNPELQDIEKYVHFELEPTIGSFMQLDAFGKFNQPIKVHLELDTGMHRMGFQKFEIDELINKIKSEYSLKIQGIYTHLAAADEQEKDEQTNNQIKRFKEYSDLIIDSVGCKPILHISNSAGSIRFHEAGGSMVRLGIGLYGIDTSGELKNDLKNVFSFKTHINQVKKVAAGEGVGYGFNNIENYERKIAIIAVGYADGFNRKFGQRNHHVLIRGKEAETIGNVCMDMTMIDVTKIECEEGDEVILFGEELSINSWADKLQTIPYEILTSISQRVRRVFISEQ